MTLRALALSVAASLGLAAAPASAQVQPPPPAQPPPLHSAPAVAEAPVHFVAQLGANFSSLELIEATMDDGSTKTLNANEGVNGSVGLAFLKLDGGRFATQATIGVEYSAISASNGSVRWLSFPLEVMEVVYLDPLRFGVGASYLLSPTVRSDGFFAGYDADMKSSVGLVLEADWVIRGAQSPRGARYTLGVRYKVQSIQNDLGGPSRSANAFGIVLGATL